jgi:hypothetical protein
MKNLRKTHNPFRLVLLIAIMFDANNNDFELLKWFFKIT